MGKKVLVVDDSVSTRWVVRKELGVMGYDAIEAESGEIALEFLSTESVDIILTDLHMPGMDGIELVRRIRALPKSKFTPILIVTTDVKDELKIEAKKSGASGWIVKPFSPEALRQTVKKLVGDLN